MAVLYWLHVLPAKRQSPLTETTKKSGHSNLLNHGDFWLQSSWHLESALVSEKVSCGAC